MTASCLALAIAAQAAHAQNANRNWDANSTTPGNGGAGTWNTSGLNWSPNADGASGPYATPWNNSLLDNAIFGGTAGTVTLGAPITAHNLTFNVDGYTLTGNTLTLSGTTPTISVNTAATERATISSVLAGSNGLTKTGAGILFLDGSNTFSGGITLSGGRLWANNDAAFGAASNTITTTADAQLSVDSGATSRTVSIAGGTTLTVDGAGVGSAYFTGAGNLNAFFGTTLSNDNNDFTGTVTLSSVFGSTGHIYFTSVRNTGQASSLGAGGTITFTRGDTAILHYTGDGDTSDRDWVMSGSNLRRFINEGTGALTLQGDIDLVQRTQFEAASEDFNLLGVLSGGASQAIFTGSGAGTITLGGANTYTGLTRITGGLVSASVLADTGVSSSFGTGSQINLENLGELSYTGAGASSNRTWSSDGLTAIRNDGTGALNLSGNLSFVAGGTDTLTLGGSSTGTSTFSGVMSGAGGLTREGSGVWELSGANTRTGAIVVSSGTLRRTNASGFGTVTGVTVNGGVLDLGGFDLTVPTLAGSGGEIALGAGNLTLNAAAAQSYGGIITGAGDLTKLGAGTLTLTGANTYTGATTVGGGTLALDFSAAGAPVNNIIAAGSPLNMAGGTLQVIGDGGATNEQTFAGTTIAAGANTIRADSGAGGTVNLNLGTVSRTSGLVNFVLPSSGSITTASASLGGWATVNGSDYAKVVAGEIRAFEETDYVDKDEVATWAAGEFISDSDGDGVSYSGTVTGSMQLSGLQFTEAAPATVQVGAGETLGVDGAIIVSSSVGTSTQTISDGNLTGAASGVLGIQHNGGGLFTINSTIVDNGGATGFTKSGTGEVVLSGANTYTGATTVGQGTLSVNSIGNGGATSAVGQSSADASNLVIQGATLEYTGGAASTNRGFTLARSGATTAGTISVTDPAANLTFSGQVTSPDAAGLTKIGDGTLTLTNAGNDYTGITTISDGTLATSSIGNGGGPSTLGASSSASSNLVIQGGGELEYTGGTTSTDRGFTINGIAGGTVDVTNAGTALTVGGNIVGLGSAPLRKAGAGTLILSGANSYGGATFIDGGRLQAGSTQAFGGPNVVTLADVAGVTLALNGFNSRISGLSGGGATGGIVRLDGATLTIGGSNVSFSGAITGAGGLTKENTSTQTFVGCNNDYTGATTLIGGSLSVDCLANGGQASGIGASISDSANLNLAGGTLLYTGGNVTTDRGFTLTGSGGINVSNAATTLEFTGVATGGNLNKSGSGTLVLSGANTYTGNTRVIGGVLRAGADNAFGPQGHMTLDNTAGVLLDLNDHDTVVTSLIGGGANGGNIDLGSATLTINSVDVRSYAGAISGTGGLVMTANNALRVQALTGCGSSYGGSTVISSGILAVSCLEDGGVNSSIGASTDDAANLILNGGTLRYDGAGSSTDRLFTLDASATSKIEASGTGTLAFTNTGAIAFASPGAAQTIRLGGTNTGDNSFGLQITDNGAGVTSFTKEDAGTWILTNAGSTYTGVTTIVGGVLGVDKLADGGQASSIGQSAGAASNLVIGSGSTLRYTGAGDSTNRLFTLDAGVSFIESSGAGAVAFTNTGTMGFQGTGARIFALGGTNTGANIMAVSITDGTGGATTVTKSDAGNWYLTGNSTYTGPTNINAGTLFIGNGGATGSITSNTVNVTGFGALGFNRLDTVTYAGTIQGSGGVTQAGAGTTILTGANSYAGGTNINAGTLQVSSDANLGAASGGLIFNGGTLATTASFTSGRDMDLAGAGAFSTNSGTTLTFTGTVSGAGTLTKSGAGTLVLAANNDYTGGTTINAGTLLVNGDQSGATGLTSITSGATLGGIGTLGGPVTVAGGGVLSPGDNGAGTLSMGALTLGATSVLNFQLGQAGTPGGALNDLINVAGALTLDGALNVTETPGGTFGPGVYRLIDYTGALNDQGLTVVSAPGGTAGLTVQTSVANQVNLVNSAGQLLSFWDVTGADNDGAVSGGTGTWRLGGGATNWTNETGTANTDYAPDTFAVFQGTAGTVTVDAAGGAVGATGMQFGVDGYTVTGAGLTLAGGAQSTIRVGDGTAGSAGWTATIGSVLSGNTQLVKDDFGTLVLSGANTYTGGTAINGGVLQISNNAALGDAAGGLSFDGGTLHTTSLWSSGRPVTLNAGGGTFQMDATSVLSGAITGVGSFTKTGLGTLLLTGTSTYSGGTTITAGALQVGSGAVGGSITGNVVNNATFSFNNPGVQTFAGTISGSGQVRKVGAGTQVLTAANSYAGTTTVTGGTLLINGDQTAATGLTNVTGGTLGGSGTIGGAVTVAAGASLAPGGAASTPGTLTIAGDLTLTGATTALNYEFGQANLPGGTFNDLLKVGGDVSLSGATINVASSAPSFGPGLYRVIDYAGTRTGTLALGSQPAGASFTVQTSVDKQVNLVNTAGLALNIWDGDAGGRNDSDIAGGSGTWQGGGAGGNDNWTLADGTVNARFADSAFAIFTKTGGAVTVDATTAGPINVSGMQFAVTGYELSGGTINLTAPESNIWVGDGTANSETMAALINANLSGPGGLVKTDAGTLLLYGNNTYAGETKVNGGTVEIGGDQTGATGATSVNSGGVLRGNGIVGGDVTVNAGGTLAPGGPYGNFTINGDLVLTSGATLAMDLGQAGTVGGALNDLITVGGDLTLDGALNVTQSAGGTFGPGIYRMINYSGALTNNTLDVGSLPGGASGFIQTAIANQVNLVSGVSTTLSFWDGPAGGKNDSAIQGGAGTWRLGGGAADWADAGGAANFDFNPDSFAVFQGTPGTVTVDDVGGAVGVSGMQFAVDGYTVAGDGLTLTGAQATLRVGDNTAAGSGMTATVASALSGSAELVKTDLGTLVLSGTNTYAGGTTINDGVLSISRDANLGDAAGDLAFGGGTLRATASFASARGVTLNAGGGVVQTDADLALSGAIGGAGGLTKTGGATLTLTGANAYGGATTVEAGTLIVDGDQSAAAGPTTVNASAVLGGLGVIGGDVLVQGDGRLSPGNGGVGALRINGDLTLAATSNLDVDFGEPGVSGGPLNDLVTVGGDANLAGATVNVAASAPSFGPGLYRVIDYAGTRTGTLTLGAAPAGSSFIVQTSVAKQVNLVNTAGLTLNMWDGTGGRNDDDVAGGDGVWQGAGGDDNWATIDGSINAPFANDAFAIFAKTGGDVTVDAVSNGPISVSGMQFAVDGYTITGDAIGLTGVANVWVGDGSLHSAGMTATIASALTGAGGLTKTDGGTLVLTGANGYGGATIVGGGRLIVDGDQSAATGLTTVNAAATLGGSGVIGGDVVVQDGGVLAPGDSPGTLTINGGLTLNAASALNMEFGQAGAVGGSLNDLIVVGGDLALDGVLDVTTSVGGAFGPGVYRVIDYAGALTDNGLTVGALPGGTGVVQTAIANQVNLVVDAAGPGPGPGPTYNFWDGAGPAADGQVNGGSGIWQAGGGNGNWTETTGAANGGFADGGFAIFGGASGVVTVDDSLGAVTVSGMQFASDSYRLQGDAITLSGPEATVRVGDGTTAGAAFTATVANELTGPGGLLKTDAGTLALTGVNTYTGATTVAGGVLAVEGSLARSAVTVRAGALLTGSGAVGGASVEAGGAVAPGTGGVGTLRIEGGFTQAAGSTYQLEIDLEKGLADRLVVAGAADLDEGATLAVKRLGSGKYAVGTRYTVLTAMGGVSGAYDLSGDAGKLTAFLGLKDSYDANNVYLTVAQMRALAEAGQTRNQVAAATGADGLASDNPIRASLLNLPDDASARAAFDQLSGEIYASAKGVMVRQSALVRDATMAQLSCGADDETRRETTCADPDRPAGWAQVLGAWGKGDGDRVAAGVDSTTSGFLMGFDLPTEGWRLGAFAGFTHSAWSVDARRSSADSDDYHLGAYGGRGWGRLSLRLGASHSWREIDTHRGVAFGDIAEGLRSENEARTGQAFADLGYRFGANKASIEPFLNLAHVRLRADGMQERGGDAALSGEADLTQTTIATVGVRPAGQISFGTVEATYRGLVGWRRAFGDVTPTATSSFAGGSAFTVQGAPIARNAMALEAGLDFRVGEAGLVSFNYGGEFSSQTTDQRVRLDVRLRF